MLTAWSPTRTESRLAISNPLALATTRYEPGGNAMLNVPSLALCAVNVSLPTNVMVALGTGWFELSEMVPVIVSPTGRAMHILVVSMSRQPITSISATNPIFWIEGKIDIQPPQTIQPRCSQYSNSRCGGHPGTPNAREAG